MTSSFAHAIARLGGIESSKAFHNTVTERQVTLHPAWTDEGGRTWRAYWSPACQGRGCYEKPVYVTSYRYVTGRTGRTTDRIQYACPLHGTAFAKRHHLALDALEETAA